MSKMKYLLLTAVMMIALAGCGGNTTTGGSADNKLTVGLMPDVDSVPFIVAAEKGYFAEEGVEVTLMPFKSAQERDSALQSGNLDGAVSDVLALCFFKEGGFDVAAASATEGSYKLIGKKDGATNLAALTDGDVAVSKNTIIEYVTDCILERGNMGDTGVNKVIIPQIPVRLEMLQNGKVDGATLPEPMATVAVADGGVQIADSVDMGINPGVFIVTKAAATNKKEAVQAMYRAYNKAATYLNTAPKEEYIDMVCEKSGFPPAARETLELPQYSKAVLPSREDVQGVSKWLKDKALVNNDYGYEDVVTDILP